MVKTPAQPDALLAWMSSLAEPTRLRLLRLLERQELGVVELCDVLQLPQSTVSRHLKVLGDQAWVRSSRQGTVHLYRMTLDELQAPARRLWLLAREQMEHWPAVRQDELRLARRLRQRHDSAAAFFAGAAGQWDRLRCELYGRDFNRLAMLALLPENYIVADLGCGTGQIAAELAAHVRQVIAVDNSQPMLRAAQKRAAGLPNIDFRRGDLAAMPVDDSACDAALLMLVLSYVHDPVPVLRETHRILKGGGRAIVVDLLPHGREDFHRQMQQRHMGFEPADMQKMLRDAGFADTSIAPLPPEPNAKGPALFLATARKSTAVVNN